MCMTRIDWLGEGELMEAEIIHCSKAYHETLISEISGRMRRIRDEQKCECVSEEGGLLSLVRIDG